MDDADTIQPLNARPRYEPGDADAFFAHVGAGGKVEADNWMPDEYRAAVLKFVEMHANSELMGVLPERDWIMRAPTLRRKLALTSKIQDEVGHAQLLYRVAEDLGKPRSQMLADLLDGKTKFHNVFHYPTRSTRTSAPAARARPTIGCPTSTVPLSSSSWRCTPTRS